MEEIKVGEYFRDFDGNVDRIEFKMNTKSNRKLIGFQKRNYYLSENGLEKIVKKHSPNIIDLIEIGDYVNGYKVLDVMENMNTGEIHLEMPMDYTNKELGDCTIYNKDIKSIVTKEQFANAEYRLED